MPTRRTLLTAVAALGLGAGTPDPYDRLLQGEGDLSAALPALAGVRFRGGDVQKSVARGLADVVGGRALSPASPARIASISKLVTALGFMTLVEAGRVGLDDPASDLLGFDLRHPSFPK
ncbi:serine hydrolase, partial [Caulobacter sp. HMWF025]|uniref:serine hydrolase n=2 Tax=unclassified Caulobacter TaxID=2648921 RepID=UPI000D484B99